MTSRGKIGELGELAVLYDLIKQGYDAYLISGSHAYDIVLDIGTKILKVQVKTTNYLYSYKKVRNIYKFHTNRPGLRVRYKKKDIDLMALIALDCNVIAYIPYNRSASASTTFRSRKIVYAHKSNARYLEDYPLSKCLKHFGAKT